MAPKKAKASKQDRNPKRGRAVPPKKGSGAKATPSSGTKKAGPAAKRPVGRPPKRCGVAAPAKLPSVDSSEGPSSQEAGKSGASRDSRLPGRGRKVAASMGKDVSPPAASRSPSGGSSRAHLRSSLRRPAGSEPSPSRRLDVKVTEKKTPKKASTAAVAASQLPAVEASVGRRDKELPVAEQAPTTSTSKVPDFSTLEVKAVKPAPCEPGKNYHCCVRDCASSTDNCRGIWMFALPQEEKLAAAWRKAVPINLRRNRPLSPRVCFQHFNIDDFVRQRLRMTGLTPTAVPCIDASKLSSSAGASTKSNRQTLTRRVPSKPTAKRSEEAESDVRVPALKASIPSEGGSSMPNPSKELESTEETRPSSEETQQCLAAASSGTVDVVSTKPRSDIEVAPPGSLRGDSVNLKTAESMRDAGVVPPSPERPSSFGATPVESRLGGGEVTPTERLVHGSERAAEGSRPPEDEDVAEERELPQPPSTPPGNLEHDGKEERPSEPAVGLSGIGVSVDGVDNPLPPPPSGASLQPGLVEAEAPAALLIPPLWENADVCELQEEVVLTQDAPHYLVSEEMDPSEPAPSLSKKADGDGRQDRLGASTSRDAPGASEAYDVRDAATILRISRKECLEDTSQDYASSGEGAGTSCAASPAPSGSQKTLEIGGASAVVKDCTKSFPEPKDPGRSWKASDDVNAEGFLPIQLDSRELPEGVPPEVQRTEADANTDAPGDVDTKGFLPIPSDSKELPEGVPPEVQRTEADAHTDAPGDVDTRGFLPIPSDSSELPEGVPPEVRRTEADANTDAPGDVDTQGFLPIPSDSRELPEGVPPEVRRTEADANTDAPGDVDSQGFLPIPSDSRELPEGVPPEVRRTEADANTDAPGDVDMQGFLPIPSDSRELPEGVPPEVRTTEADANTDAPGDVDTQGFLPIPSDSRELPDGVPPEVQRTEAVANTDAPGDVDTQGFLPIPSDSRELPEGVPPEVRRTEADANTDAPGDVDMQGFLPIPSDSRELPEGVPPKVQRTEADANTDISGDGSSGMPPSFAADPRCSSGAVGAHRSSLPTTNSMSSVPTSARGKYVVVETPVGDEGGAYMCAVVWEGDGDPDWSDKEEEEGSDGDPPALTFQEVQEDLPWLLGGAPWEIQEGPDGIVVTESGGSQGRVVVSRDLTASSFLGNRRVLGPRQITEVNDLIVFFKVLIAR